MIDTLGRAKFRAWRAKEPKLRTQAWVAAQLEIQQPSVAAWDLGHSRPVEKHRLALASLSAGEVPASDWATDAEKRRAKPAPVVGEAA